MKLIAIDYADYARPIYELDLRVGLDKSLGSGSLVEPWPGADPFQGAKVAGLMRHLDARTIAYRFLTVLTAQEFAWFRERFVASAMAGGQDPVWIDVGLLEDSRHVALLTEDQLSMVAPSFAHVEVELPNEQQARALAPAPAGRLPNVGNLYGAERLNTETYGPLEQGDWRLQLHPSWVFHKEINHPHAVWAVASSTMSNRWSTDQVLVRNHDLEQQFPNLRFRIAVRIVFSDKMPGTWALALDETAMLAVGLRCGEPCHVLPIPQASSRLQRRPRVTRYRHVLARIDHSVTGDTEKPVCRMPIAALDVLGIQSGARVVVEYFHWDDHEPSISRVPLRALEERPHPSSFRRLRGREPDFFDEAGSVDLPAIRLDQIRRLELDGVRRGAAVYVRPSTGTIAAEHAGNLAVAAARRSNRGCRG